MLCNMFPTSVLNFKPHEVYKRTEKIWNRSQLYKAVLGSKLIIDSYIDCCGTYKAESTKQFWNLKHRGTSFQK